LSNKNSGSNGEEDLDALGKTSGSKTEHDLEGDGVLVRLEKAISSKEAVSSSKEAVSDLMSKELGSRGDESAGVSSRFMFALRVGSVDGGRLLSIYFYVIVIAFMHEWRRNGI
jgi:hypothetical protein